MTQTDNSAHETQAFIEMLESQRNQALKGEAVAFAKFRVAEMRIHELDNTVSELNSTIEALQEKAKNSQKPASGKKDGRTD